MMNVAFDNTFKIDSCIFHASVFRKMWIRYIGEDTHMHFFCLFFNNSALFSNTYSEL